jgi:hypothetical protein
MRASTQTKVGIITALFFVAFAIPVFTMNLVLLIVGKSYFSVLPVFINTIMICAPLFYIYAILRKLLKVAKWMYYASFVFVIYFGLLFVGFSLFVAESQEHLVRDAILLSLIAVIFGGLLMLPLKVGIKGLTRILEVSDSDEKTPR